MSNVYVAKIKCEIVQSYFFSKHYSYHQIISFPLKLLIRNLTMGSRENVSLQDVIRCDLCEAPVPTKHCDVCHIHLCEECEGEHISDKSKEHVIVSFQMQGSTPKCSKHSTETCARYCKKCNTPICSYCDSSGKHKRHKTEDISKMADVKKTPRKTDLQTGSKCSLPRVVLEIIIPLICIIIIIYGVKFVLIRLVFPDGKIHLLPIVIVLDAILSFFLQDSLFYCLKHVCGLDFAPSHFFEYLKCLMTKIKEPRKFNLQRATEFSPLKMIFKLSIYMPFIFIYTIEYNFRFYFIFSVIPGQKIYQWPYVNILIVILLLCLVDFLFFCLKHVCGLDFIDCGYIFEYLKWLITRIKELKKNDSQTTTNVTLPKMSGRCVIVNVCFNVIFSAVFICLGFILFFFT